MTMLAYCFDCGCVARMGVYLAYHHQRGVMGRVTRIDSRRDTRDLIILFAREADLLQIVLFLSCLPAFHRPELCKAVMQRLLATCYELIVFKYES